MKNFQRFKGPDCLRCRAQLDFCGSEGLEDQDQQFFRCPSCGSEYARGKGEQLHDRWMMPLSLVLYSVTHAEDPESEAGRVARRLKAQKSDIKISEIVAHIRDEIGEPKQNVSEILKCVATEDKLRRFLVLVADLLVMQSVQSVQSVQSSLSTRESGPKKDE